MKFLANENIPLKSIQILREVGHDVIAIGEDFPGIQDNQVLNLAVQKNRIVLTFDRDYGELIFKRGLPTPPGVIYFRFVPFSPEETAEFTIDLLQLKELTLDGKFTIIERGRVRQRPLPQN